MSTFALPDQDSHLTGSLLSQEGVLRICWGWLTDVPPVTVLDNKFGGREHPGGAPASKGMIRDDLSIKVVTAM